MEPASAQAKVLRARNVLLQSPHLGNHLGGSYSLVRPPAEPFSRPGRSIRAPSRGAAVKAGRPSGGHSKSLALMAASTAARSCGTGETCKEWLGRHPYTDHTKQAPLPDLSQISWGDFEETTSSSCYGNCARTSIGIVQRWRAPAVQSRAQTILHDSPRAEPVR